MNLTVDLKQLEMLRPEMEAGAHAALDKVTERGKEILREEVPGGTQSALAKGVSSEPGKADNGLLESKLIVSAMREREARTAILHLPSGKTKEIRLRATEAFDYAEGVAEGTGLYGPKGALITPQHGRALLIGVKDVRPDEAYIEDGNQKFIVRPSSEGMKPNDYAERAATRLEAESEEIAASALVESGVAQV